MAGEGKQVDFYRHTLLNRGGDKMVLAHAAWLAHAGYRVTIWVSKVDTLFPVDDKISIMKIHSRSKAGTLWKALRFCSKSDYVIADIIPLAVLLGVLNRKKTIYFAQDYDESYYMKGWQRLLVRGLYFLGLSLMKLRTIAVADHLTELLRRRFGARAVTVNNGIDQSIFYHDPDPDLISSKEGRKSIVILSRPDPRKGFDLGKKILARLQNQVRTSEIEIWSVGSPVEGGFPGYIHRDLGYVGAEKLRKVFSSADVFLYHTRHEGFPLMALEALACGCPMAASHAVSVVEPSREALISPIGDVDLAATQLVGLLSDDAVAVGLRKHGLEFARSHSLEQSSREFEHALLNGDWRKRDGGQG